MTVLDGPLRSVSKTLIEKFGKSMTLQHVATGVYNTTTGSADQTPTDETVRGVVDRYRSHEINETIRRTDVPVYLAASDLDAAPNQDDKLLVDSTVYEVKNVDPIYSGDEVAVYLVQARR